MFNRILFLVLLCVLYNNLAVFCQETDPEFRYDYKYYEDANGWLKLHYAPMRWEAARLQCYYEGAVLASPLNDRLRIGITKYLQDRKSCPNVMFSGVSASFAEGVYTSVEGVPLERMPIHWSDNEPVHPDGCLVLYSNGTMGSKYCTDYFPFVCYKKYEKMAINECGTVDDKYQRFNISQTKCYKYHSEREDWSTAYKICRAEGGHLVNEEHIDAVQNDFQREIQLQKIAIGVKLVNGIWWDTHGNLARNRRQGEELDLACGARSWEGLFSPAYCTEYIPFICEKAIDSLLPSENDE